PLTILRPFPPRRSSDLAGRHGISAERIARRAQKEGWPARLRRAPGAREGPVRKQDRDPATLPRSSTGLTKPAPKGGSTATIATTDRKSTRLNSSHVKIS